MACELVFTCDYCGEQVINSPLAGHHTEVRVMVRYPDGWDFDSDGDAMCPACVLGLPAPAAQGAPQEAQA